MTRVNDAIVTDGQGTPRGGARPWQSALVLALMLVLGWCVPSPAAAGDWPGFRGPNRDGISTETGILKSWPASGPRECWRREIGDGFAGIAAVGGKLFTLYGVGDDEYLAAFDAGTGKEIWKTLVGPKFHDDYGDGPRSTPTVDGDMVYVLGSHGKLLAAGASDGKQVWAVQLHDRFGSRTDNRGFASSPLVDGDLVITDAGGGKGKAYAALNKTTGATVWTSQDGRPKYTSPIVVEINGVRQYIFIGSEQISALSQKGALQWSFPWKRGTIAVPIFIPPNRILISAAYDIGAAVLEVKKQGPGALAEEVWSNRRLKNHFSSSIVRGDHVYGFDNATFKAMDIATGEEAWAVRGYGKGSLLYADGHFFVLSDSGKLALVEATSAGHREKASAQVLEGKSWTAPTLSNGRLYLRNHTQMVCLRVK